MSEKTREQQRLEEARTIPWRKWGPYLSERQWGTVRENTSRDIEAWYDFTHDQARSRAYLSGEDGIAGFCDDRMLLCFALAFWNGRDPILKERLFGLTNSEGNHGEDVKEYYFYLDNTPTHSYARLLYKYPQTAFPYENLVSENRRRSRYDMEYELLDTGAFDDDRYWDIAVEFAKAAPEDICIQITATNRGPDRASLHVLPHLWFRNTWRDEPEAPVPQLEAIGHDGRPIILARHHELGNYHLYCENSAELLFTNNESNCLRLWNRFNPTPYVKDGIDEYIVKGFGQAVNPARKGTKSAAHHTVAVAPGESATIRVRLAAQPPAEVGEPFGAYFERTLADRKREADEFYASIIPPSLSPDAASVVRQGYSGLLWTKQAYIYDVDEWLRLRGVHPGTPGATTRNQSWFHLYSADVISMPDKWEYPWFAAWDLAFHSVALAFVDPDLAHQQLDLMLTDRYQHPNGQLPAYEWNFDDVNPPVHAWAALFNYRLNRDRLGASAIPFLKRTFHMLLTNFTWWLNRKDRDGRNIFEGGFLGLDNIGVFDRSAPLPTGGYLEQADGTAWMAFFAQNMLDIALELAVVDPTYEDVAIRFYEHVIRIAAVMARAGTHDALWDEEDGFFYDVLRVPGQWSTRIKVRSVVGLLPLCAVSTYHPDVVNRLPRFMQRVRWFNNHRPDLLADINRPGRPGASGCFMLSLLSDGRLRQVLRRMLDPAEFLSEYGIRSLSRYHLDHPYVFYAGSQEFRVSYLPAESDSGMFGGNSNWRGPIWAPINALIIRALLQSYSFYGDDFRVECPTGSGQQMTLYEVAQELSNRLASMFLRNHRGHRPVYGGARKFQEDPHWRDNILFYEYFHGDNGAGLGAGHQTGWTALVPALMHLFANLSPSKLLSTESPFRGWAEPSPSEAPGPHP